MTIVNPQSLFPGTFKDIRPVGARISTGPATPVVPLMKQLDELVNSVVPAIRSRGR